MDQRLLFLLSIIAHVQMFAAAPFIITPDGTSVLLQFTPFNYCCNSTGTWPLDEQEGSWDTLNSTAPDISNSSSILENITMILVDISLSSEETTEASTPAFQNKVLVAKFAEAGSLVPEALQPTWPTLIENVTTSALSTESVLYLSRNVTILNDTLMLVPEANMTEPDQNVVTNYNSIRKVRSVQGSSHLPNSSTALVSTELYNDLSNQTFSINKNAAIVAILPPGTNLTATWNTSAITPNFTRLLSQIVNEAAKNFSSITGSNGEGAGNSNVRQLQPEVTDVVVMNATAEPFQSPPTGSESAMKSAMWNSSLVPVALPVMGSLTSSENIVPTTVSSIASNVIIVQQNHRIEVQLTGYELRATENRATPVALRNINIWVRFTVGTFLPGVQLMELQQSRDLTPINANKPVLVDPVSTTGYALAFNDTYNGTATFNKVLSADLCGKNADKGILSVITRSNSSDGFSPLLYRCAINLNFQTAVRSTESFWSSPQQCNSPSSENGYNQILWYKIRNYNIDWAQCQENPPAAV